MISEKKIGHRHCHGQCLTHLCLDISYWKSQSSLSCSFFWTDNYILWGLLGKFRSEDFQSPGKICGLVAILLFVSGYKIVRKPAMYYSPNMDFMGDIQNADYKTFFSEWRNKYPNFESYPILAGPFDSLSWYTDRYPTATFNRFIDKATFHPEFGNIEYSNLTEFVALVSKYPKGFCNDSRLGKLYAGRYKGLC